MVIVEWHGDISMFAHWSDDFSSSHCGIVVRLLDLKSQSCGFKSYQAICCFFKTRIICVV